MNFRSLSNYRLPGIRGFIKRSAVFENRNPSAVTSAKEIVAKIHHEFRSGNLKPGDYFPCPDELSKLTGAPLVASLDAVTQLIHSGRIRQAPSGSLSISPPPAY